MARFLHIVAIGPLGAGSPIWKVVARAAAGKAHAYGGTGRTTRKIVIQVTI